MRTIYATDLDRTLIFSKRFLDEYNNNETEYSLVETFEGKEISYISNKVKNKLHELNNNSNVEIVPVTSRSIDEYNRIKLPITPEYTILSCGGTILKNGEPIKEYEDYISRNIKRIEMMSLAMDLEDLKSVNRDSKFIDNKYIFTKTDNPEYFDSEIEALNYKYPNFIITRQKFKVYAVPSCFNKGVALRWLQNYLGINKIVASGDSELDLPMLAIANYAVIPDHGELVKNGYVRDGRIISDNINSPLHTIKLVEEVSNE